MQVGYSSRMALKPMSGTSRSDNYLKIVHKCAKNKKNFIDNVSYFQDNSFKSHPLQVALIESRSAIEENRKYFMVS